MTSWLDRRRLWLVAGSVATLALGYLFVQYVVFTLSLTVRAVLLLGVALVFLCWTASPGRGRELPAFGMVAALITVLVYTIVKFEIPPAVLALLVLGTLVGVSALAYYVQNGQLAMGKRTAASAALVVVLLCVAVVGIDLLAGGVTYSATLEETVTFGNGSMNVISVQAGTATATNTYLFREPVDFPDTRACIYTGGQRQDLGIIYKRSGEEVPPSIAGGGQVETWMDLRVKPETANAVSGPIPIERARTCPPPGSGPPRVLIVDAPTARGNATG